MMTLGVYWEPQSSLREEKHHYPVGQPLLGDSLPFLLTCRFTTWSRKGVVGTLGMYPGRGLSGQRESRPARTQGTLHSLKCLEGPDPLDEGESNQEHCLNRQIFKLN